MNPQFIFNIGAGSPESSERQGALPEPGDLATVARGQAAAGTSLPEPVNLAEIASASSQQAGAGLPSPAPLESFTSATRAASAPSPEPLEALGIARSFGEPPSPLPIEQVFAAAGLGLRGGITAGPPEPVELEGVRGTHLPHEEAAKGQRGSKK